MPSRSFSLLKMLFARTTASQVGTALASKASASSMSKMMTLPRENLTMK
jgi:hypothetical protein